MQNEICSRYYKDSSVGSQQLYSALHSSIIRNNIRYAHVAFLVLDCRKVELRKLVRVNFSADTALLLGT